ncbi:hypothetical protein N7530_002948 [Penicillium desertorum]|uniref:Uncharacterized protein n=1 Tax=Penicillium desertorum TaxID=1303715 RepID=A0A9W9X4B3_9EURO|nr:hypothetical protein N7530_002948 [Penicillium desertorum]
MLVQNVKRYENVTDEENLEKSAKEQQDFIERHKDNKTDVAISFPAGMKRFPEFSAQAAKAHPSKPHLVFELSASFCGIGARGIRPRFVPLSFAASLRRTTINWDLKRPSLWLQVEYQGQLEPYIGAGSYSSVWNGTVVSEAHAPSWMQTSAQKVVSGLSRIKEVYASDNLAPIKVEVKWVRGTNVARYMETRAAIEKALEREVALPPSKFRPPWDPRVSARSKQFRDSIRRSLNCQELGLDLQAILIRYDHAAEDEVGHTDGFSQDGKGIKEMFDNPQYSNCSRCSPRAIRHGSRHVRFV